MRTPELLEMLNTRGIMRSRMAEVLGVAPSRITEIFKNERRVTLDEAAALIEAFNLEQKALPLPLEICRALIGHVVTVLDAKPGAGDPVEALAKDLHACVSFALENGTTRSAEEVRAFLEGRGSLRSSGGNARTAS